MYINVKKTFSAQNAQRTNRSDRKGRAVTGGGKARPRILIIAYSCNPRGGSEAGVGWGLLQAVARFANCVVLVSSLYLPFVRNCKTRCPNVSISFVGVPEGKLRRLSGKHRTVWFIAYLLWLRKAASVGKRLHRNTPFDLVFHATVTPYWLPSPISSFNVPKVWGPVGGAVTSHIPLWPILGIRGLADELLDFVSVRFFSWLPATRRTWNEVTVALVNNDETFTRLPARLQARSRILNHVLFLPTPRLLSRKRHSHMLYFSALETRKGPRLALHALYYTPEDVQLRIAGDGPEFKPLVRLANRLRVSHRVEFLRGLTRQQAHEQISVAAAVVFTGMREEGGASLAEAMLVGAPVIVLANGGAKTVAEMAVDPTRVRLIQPADVSTTARNMGAAMVHFSRNPPAGNTPNLDTKKAYQTLRSAFEQVLKLRSAR